MLSLAAISTSVKEVPGLPSTFILKADALPPCNTIEEMFMRELFLFLIRKFLVEEPMVVNTVSNKMESCENDTFAPESVVNLFFLHEKKLNTTNNAVKSMTILKMIFKACKYKRINFQISI